MKAHVDTVGILFVVYGAMNIAIAGLIALVFIGLAGMAGVAGASGGDDDLLIFGGIYGGLGVVIAVLASVFAIPNIVVGMALRKRRAWARIGGFVMGALALTNMPLGTILGIYAFVTLLDKDVAEEFAAASVA